jgi:hypothetical protein
MKKKQKNLWLYDKEELSEVERRALVDQLHKQPEIARNYQEFSALRDSLGQIRRDRFQPFFCRTGDGQNPPSGGKQNRPISSFLSLSAGPFAASRWWAVQSSFCCSPAISPGAMPRLGFCRMRLFHSKMSFCRLFHRLWRIFYDLNSNQIHAYRFC